MHILHKTLITHTLTHITCTNTHVHTHATHTHTHSHTSHAPTHMYTHTHTVLCLGRSQKTLIKQLGYIMWTNVND